MTQKPLLQNLEQLLLLHFAPLFLILFDLAQHLDQRLGRCFSQALLQRTWHRQHCHDSDDSPSTVSGNRRRRPSFALPATCVATQGPRTRWQSRARDAIREIADHNHVMLCDNAPMATVRTFNTEGPVVAADHYCIPPLERIDLDAVLGLIRDFSAGDRADP